MSTKQATMLRFSGEQTTDQPTVRGSEIRSDPYATRNPVPERISEGDYVHVSCSDRQRDVAAQACGRVVSVDRGTSRTIVRAACADTDTDARELTIAHGTSGDGWEGAYLDRIKRLGRVTCLSVLNGDRVEDGR
jgi:hypothetical protein